MGGGADEFQPLPHFLGFRCPIAESHNALISLAPLCNCVHKKQVMQEKYINARCGKKQRDADVAKQTFLF